MNRKQWSACLMVGVMIQAFSPSAMSYTQKTESLFRYMENPQAVEHGEPPQQLPPEQDVMENLFSSGTFLPEAEKKAIKTPLEQLKTSAESGNAEAMYSLYVLHVLGRGAPQDDRIAMEWLNKAVALVYSPA